MINILFCGNDKVFDGLLTCSLSILKRSRLDEPISFYIFTMDVSHIKDTYVPISNEMVEFFDTVVKGYNPENRAIKIDVTNLYMEHFDKCPNESAYCSPYTLIRLFADKVDSLPEVKAPGESKKEFKVRTKNIKHPLIEKIFNEIAPKYAERAKELGQGGGYTRIYLNGQRKGDAAETAIIELV